jgi:hypothetical protein
VKGVVLVAECRIPSYMVTRVLMHWRCLMEIRVDIQAELLWEFDRGGGLTEVVKYDNIWER